MHRRRRTALVLTAAIAAAAPLLTACGNDAHPGAAAVVGGQRITVGQLENRVEEVRQAQRAAVPDEAQYQQVVSSTSGLTRDTLHNMVLDRVLHRAAQDHGISVTRKEIQQMRADLERQAGGSKGLETAWLQKYGIAPGPPRRQPAPATGGAEARREARHRHQPARLLEGPVQGLPRHSTSTSTRATAPGTCRRAAGWTPRRRGCGETTTAGGLPVTA